METFEVKIDFAKDEAHPERIFKSLAAIIECLNSFDKSLCKTIPTKIEADTLLEDVERGSIRVILRQIIKSIDDEGLQNADIKKIFGKYLKDAKYFFLKFLEDKENIDNVNKLEQLREDIFQLGQKTDNKLLPVYGKINTPELVSNIDKMNNSFGLLTSKDKVQFKIGDKQIPLEYNSNFSAEKFEDLLVSQTLETCQKLILKVKKPDYLGDSKWEFRHGANSFTAKISDIEWLRDFQNRKVDIRPKDSIECEIKITTSYDNENELLNTKYEVLKVVSVQSFSDIIQGHINEI